MAGRGGPRPGCSQSPFSHVAQRAHLGMAPALMAAMTDFVDPGTAEYFMRASFGAQPI